MRAARSSLWCLSVALLVASCGDSAERSTMPSPGAPSATPAATAPPAAAAAAPAAAPAREAAPPAAAGVADSPATARIAAGLPPVRETTPSRSTTGPPQPAATSAAAPPPSSQMAPTPGTVTRDTELKAKPVIDAATLAALPARSAVTILERRGGWLRVASGRTEGWVRLLHVSSQPPGGRASTAQELETAARVATGRAGTGNIVVTTGIRGLSEEQLRQAQADPEQVERLERLAVDAAQAGAYAAAHRLERRQVPYLANPGERRDAKR